MCLASIFVDAVAAHKATTAIPSDDRSRRTAQWANIWAKADRRWKDCFSPFLYSASNAVERMFRRLKGYRRIAARCDRKAANFLAAVCIAAASATA